MNLSEEMRNFDGMHFPYREYGDKVAQLESENEALRLDRNLYDKGWDEALDRLRTYRELLSNVGDYFKRLGPDCPARLASKVFDALLTEENEEE